MLSSFLFIKWRKEKEREKKDEEAVIKLSLQRVCLVRWLSERKRVVTLN